MYSSPVIIPNDDEEFLSSRRNGLFEQSRSSPQHVVYYAENATDPCLRDDSWAVGAIREAEGRCGKCGLQTHSFERKPVAGFLCKFPLTVSDEVYRGRCLLCHPLPDRFVAQNMLHQGRVESSTTIRSNESTPVSEDATNKESSNIVEYAGEYEGVIHAMLTFRFDKSIQEAGCQELWIQSWDDETSRLIGRYIGGVDAVLDAMMRFPRNTRLQLSACGALQNLASSAINRVVIVERGGAALVVQAMMRHRCAFAIQRSACNALAAMAMSTSLRNDILQAGAGLAIVHSLRKFHAEEAFCFEAMQVLEVLGFAY